VPYSVDEKMDQCHVSIKMQIVESKLGFMVVEIANGRMKVTSYNEIAQVLHLESIVG
jgi:hypothetical protein